MWLYNTFIPSAKAVLLDYMETTAGPKLIATVYDNVEMTGQPIAIVPVNWSCNKPS